MSGNSNDGFEDNGNITHETHAQSFWHEATDTEGITRARRIARYLSDYSWYFPTPNVRKSDDTISDDLVYPRLDVAWEYFEHVGLPRCFKETDESGNHELAEPGEIEKPTMLYSVWSTPLVNMGSFGVGVGLYFYTLKFFTIMTFIAGLINIPALISLYGYSPDGRQDSAILSRVSAICTQMEWRPCPTCTEADWKDRFPSFAEDRFAVEKASNMTFIKINNCKMDNIFGIWTYASLIFVIICVYVLNYLQKLKATKFDEAQQTGADYSIKIMNPPSTAKDLDSWKNFFESTKATVDVCTVALDNERLIKTLVDRRRSLIALENLLPLGAELNLDNLNMSAEQCFSVPLWKKLICCAKSPERLVADVRQKDDEIVAFAKDPNFNVARVFVTFNTQASQRSVLKALSVPWLETNTNKVSERLKYEGTVLKIVEPDEPISIRWSDLSKTGTEKVAERGITMLFLIVLTVAGCAVIVWADSVGPRFTSFVIIVQKYLIPVIVSYLTSFESHSDESSMAASKYLKITIFRWVITVIAPYVMTPFATILDYDSLIKKIEVLFIAELIQRPIIKAVDIPGIIYRHILGPRAVDQRRMNLMFSGGTYDIGERYTDITTVFLLTLFYCMLYPMGFFFASAIFVAYYWVDKFCILRSWKQGSPIGMSMANTSMFYFKICILANAIMAAYIYSQFPYDNACLSDDDDLSAYTTGSFDVKLLNNDIETIQIMTINQGYKFCDQELLRSGVFPPMPALQSDVGGTWMSETQEKILQMFGWTSVAVLTIVLASFANILFRSIIYPLFFNSYKPRGKAMDIKFEDVQEIAAYVPQVKVRGFAYPFLLCNEEKGHIDPDHVGWNDPEEIGYASHNLINDVKSVLKRRELEHDESTIDALFSSVKSYINSDGTR